MTTDSDNVDKLPRQRRPGQPPALWWALIAVAAVVGALLLTHTGPHRAAPAEHNTSVVDRAPIQLPAAK